jgi:hypothetical protein
VGIVSLKKVATIVVTKYCQTTNASEQNIYFPFRKIDQTKENTENMLKVTSTAITHLSKAVASASFNRTPATWTDP